MTADKEKRRAISREAARRRRRVESDVFRDLSRLLPLQPSVRAHLDKPSIIRLSLSYIRMHTLLKETVGTNAEAKHTYRAGGEGVRGLDCCAQRDVQEKVTEELMSSGESNTYLRILEGFLMVLSTEGDMIFLSDNVSKYMGLTQTELMGHNIFEYTHPCDHEEIRHNLRLNAEEVYSSQKRDFILRIKSALTHRGRSTSLKSATWKVLHCQGRVKTRVASSSVSCILLTCRPLPLSHTLLSSHSFTSQHSMDMRFTYCDQRVTSLLGYRPEELLGRSIYDLCHTLDTNCLNKNHLNLRASKASTCLCSVSEESVGQWSVQDAGERWGLCVGGESRRRHPQCPDLQNQIQLSPATLHPLCDLCSQWGGGAISHALLGPDYQKLPVLRV
ncbi:endothelial PAS domain-containing protein 1 isoform 1-T1 [Menidia menidia]